MMNGMVSGKAQFPRQSARQRTLRSRPIGRQQETGRDGMVSTVLGDDGVQLLMEVANAFQSGINVLLLVAVDHTVSVDDLMGKHERIHHK